MSETAPIQTEEPASEASQTSEATLAATEAQGDSPPANADKNEETRPFRKSRNLFDPSTRPVSDDPAEIRKQVEFYFSDSNLANDKFMYEKVGGAENKPVKISLIHSFKRMTRFQPYKAVVAALKDSTFLNIENEEITRKVPFDISAKDVDQARELWLDKTMDRSIYAKGFGNETPSTQFDIEAFFAPHGPVNAVRLRRTDTGGFKRSVFVEFQDEATMKKFMDLAEKPKWEGNDLQWMTKQQYVEKKAGEIRAGRGFSRGRGGRSRGRDGRGRGRGNGRGRDLRNERWTKDRNGESEETNGDSRKRRAEDSPEPPSPKRVNTNGN